MLDISYVYMDIYLPTADAGQVRIGTDARIVLDAYPDRRSRPKSCSSPPRRSSRPKTVETKTERDKLMFRIRVRIDPDRLRATRELVRSGLPGVAYVRTDPHVPWPPRLQGTAAAMNGRATPGRAARQRHASLWARSRRSTRHARCPRRPHGRA